MINRNSIATRLTVQNMLVSGAALLIACTAFFIYDQLTFRDGLVRTLSAQAEIIASNSMSALIFNDPQSAANTLAALKNSPNIASAGIVTADKRPFAQFNREAGDEILNIPGLAPDQVEAHFFRETHVVLVRRISSDQNLLGFVYLRADLREMNKRLRRYALISLGVLLLSLLFALLVSSTFRKSVAQPIAILAATARQISRDRDYSVRMRSSEAGEEVAVLIHSFNEMLNEIQRRDVALRTAHDELEKRVAERTRELVSTNRELEAFSYSVSHDLRGPIESINGFIFVLRQQYATALGPDGEEIVQQIRDAAKRMRQLIDDLLDLSRVTTSVMHSEDVDLSSLAQAISVELCRSDPARVVDFAISPTPFARGDAHLLRIVLENLFRNAWKYTSKQEKARIQFGADQRNDEVIYFVRDDGAGFDPALAGRLFQPFQRLHSTTEFQGTGIGLATVQRILHRHGGQIWAEGAIRQGATFYFTVATPGA